MNLSSFKKLNPQKKIFVHLALIIVAVGLIITLVIMPTIDRVSEDRQMITSQKYSLNESYLEIKDLRIAKQGLDRIEDQRKILDSVFINQNRELEFITTLEGIANRNNVELTINLNPPDTTDQSLKKVPLELAASGAYSKIMNFLFDVETLRYYINPTNLEIASNPQTLSSYGENLVSPTDLSRSRENSNVSLRLYADTFWR